MMMSQITFLQQYYISSLQYVVVPTRRSSAEAIQILISHALGDAGSPYLIGIVSHIAPHLPRYDRTGFHNCATVCYPS